MKNLCPTLVFCYDGDDAGQAATWRAAHMALAAGADVHVIRNTTKLDPDEIIRQRGAEALQDLLKQEIVWPEFMLAYLSRSVNFANYLEKKEYAAKAQKEIAALSDPVDREHFAKVLEDQTGFTIQVNADKDASNRSLPERHEAYASARTPDGTVQAEEQILAMMLASRQAAQHYTEAGGFLMDPLHSEVANLIVDAYRSWNEVTPARLIDYLIDQKATSLTWAVSALCIISGLKGFSYKVPSAIHRVMFSGEVMPARQLAIWQKYLPDALYVNLYGPSEITCNCTYEVIDHVVQKGQKLSLGKVFPGRKVVLLDKDGRQVDGIGAEGEIAVSGESLALGYYHNPEQTRTHFVMRDGVRTYLTGDLAAIGEDGKLYFAGRRDFQIKHMGHRIELEEVERGIDSMDGVERSCCAYNQERSLIIAYYTGTCDKRDLHIALKNKLPVYMVPNRFVHVKSFILNKNGKIDRKQLANLEVVQ